MPTELSGSAPREMPAGASPLPDDAHVDLLIVLARRAPLVVDAAHPIDRDTLAARYGAHPDALRRVLAHATKSGLQVGGGDVSTRLVALRGTAAQVQAAFGTALTSVGSEVIPAGPVLLPDEIVGDVLAVLGLDSRPAARQQTRRRAVTPDTAYTPIQIAARYDFPAGDGTGQAVGIVELGGGYASADLAAYATSLGLPAPAVTAVSVSGATNAPTGDPDGPDGEVALDIEVIGSLVPAADIAVYFAPNTDAGFLAAVSAATHDPDRHVGVISVSWGSAESTWTPASMTAFDAAIADAAALGITVCVASGDSGSSDGVSGTAAHVDFPASSPHALGCGGTSLPTAGTEVVWNDGSQGGAGGGGVSMQFAVPSFQVGLDSAPGVALSGRGVPDVAGDADPDTGYRVRIDGSDTVIGGTSAVAPLWSALLTRIAQRNGASRWVTPVLYALPPGAFHDITSGSNGAYRAAVGWDACSGLGRPIGAVLTSDLAAVPLSPAVPPGPLPSDVEPA